MLVIVAVPEAVPVVVAVVDGVTVLVSEPVLVTVTVALYVAPGQLSPGCTPNQNETVKLSAQSLTRVHTDPVAFGASPVSVSGKAKPPGAAASASPAKDHSAALKVAVSDGDVIGEGVLDAVSLALAVGVTCRRRALAPPWFPARAALASALATLSASARSAAAPAPADAVPPRSALTSAVKK